MNLHRSSGTPDWQQIPADKRNIWQRMAARTHGFVTPGNAFTTLGLLLVLLGLLLVARHHYWWGLAGVVVGRMCDIWDGMIADRTGTKSPLGEALDAGFDKLASLAAFIVLIIAHVVPVPASLLLFVPNLTNSLLTILCGRKGFTLHPSRYGKNFMAAGWVSIGGFVLVASLDMSRTSPLALLSYGFAGLSFLLGVTATVTYYQVFRGRPQ